MKKEKHSAFLKFIIAYKALISLVELAISISFFKFLDKNLEFEFTKLAINLNLDIENHIVNAAIKKLGMMGNGTLFGIASFVFAIGVINMVEAWGLHLRRRWAEWLTVIATSLLIPLEVYEVVLEVTIARVGILILNIMIVYYLAEHKELFRSKRRKRKAAGH